MELTIHELDDINDIQSNLPTAEFDAALATLRRDALIELRRDCPACAARQTDIAARVTASVVGS